jgi:DNA (cytosine-5)-methyltransferase 1
MSAYYNEIDPYAAEWLRNLIEAGHIAPGIVDERSIEDVLPSELEGFTQCHFFAGIGVWSLALRRAGWSDDRQVWTGSCPCQPFSSAAKAGGFDDERHLWPTFHHLIEQCKPSVVFGEQVASKDGLGWLDLVQADLEGTGYSTGAVDICAAGIGAPHIRQRLWFVAERLGDISTQRLEGLTRDGDRIVESRWEQAEPSGSVAETSSVDRLGNTESRRERTTLIEDGVRDKRENRATGASNGVADSEGRGRRKEQQNTAGMREGVETTQHETRRFGASCPTNGLWRDADWLFCRDGKWRSVEPGTFPLAHGSPSRVGRLRAYGNAINAEVAETFIKGYMEC